MLSNDQAISHLNFSVWFVVLFCFLQNEQAFEEVFQNANFRSFTFRIRVKLETYNVREVMGQEQGLAGGCHLVLLASALSAVSELLPTPSPVCGH